MRVCKCGTCGETSSELFDNSRNYICKKCMSAWTKTYEKTHKGFLMRLYRNMESRIKGIQKAKYHLYKGKELWSREEFYSWANNNPQFKILFDAYEKSGYDRKLAPSVDRLDSTLGYSSDNCEFVTMSENSRRGNESKQNKKREFTAEQILEMRYRYSIGENTYDLSKEFKSSYGKMTRILNNKTYKTN